MPYYVPFYLGFQMNIIDPINSTRLLWRCWTSPRFGRDDFLGSKHVDASNRIGYGVALVSPWMALSQQKGCHGYSWHLPTRLHLVTRLCVCSHAVQIKTYPEKTLHVHNVIKHINVFKKTCFYIYIFGFQWHIPERSVCKNYFRNPASHCNPLKFQKRSDGGKRCQSP
jgi:hypothetical protein